MKEYKYGDTSINFIHVKGNTWCLKGTTNIPVYFLDKQNVVIFDSGYKDERTRPYLDALISEENLTVRSAIGSHAHYDHIGNHLYLKEKYGTEIILPELEAALAYNYMMFSPVYGQYAKKELQNIFSEMTIKPDRVIPQESKTFDIDGRVFKVIDLKGHTPGHIGFITPDDVFYVADAIMGIDEIKASKLPTTLDWEEDLASKKKLLMEKHDKYILAHGGIYDEIESLVIANMKDREERVELVGNILKEQSEWSLESIQHKLWTEFNMTTKNPFNKRIYSRNVYYLVNYMVNIGVLESYPEDGIVYYRVINS